MSDITSLIIQKGIGKEEKEVHQCCSKLHVCNLRDVHSPAGFLV